MKSCEVKVQAVRKHGLGKEASRIGLLTLVALMILVVSTGTTMAAPEKPDASKQVLLWDISEDSPKPAEHLKPTEKEEWLGKLSDSSLDADSLKPIFKKFQGEPLKLVELVRSALLDGRDESRVDLADKLHTLLEDKEVQKALDSDPARRAHLAELLQALAALAKEEPEKFEKLASNKALIKEFFKGKESLLASLKLTDKNPKSESLVDKRAEEAERKLKEEQERSRQLAEQVENANRRLQGDSASHGVDELNDAQLKAFTQPICDMWTAWKNEQSKLRSESDKDRDALNELINEKYAQHPSEPKKSVKKEKDPVDSAIEKLLNPEKEKPQQVAQNTPAPASSSPSKKRREEDEPAKTEATPPQQEQQQRPQYQPKAAKRVDEGEIQTDVPTNSVNMVNADVTNANNAVLAAQNVLANPLPDTTNKYTGQPNNPRDLARKLGDQQTAVESLKANLTSLKMQMGEDKTALKDQIAVLEDSALPPEVKAKENEFSAKADELDRKAEKAEREFKMTGDPDALQKAHEFQDQAEEQRAALDRYKKKEPIANKKVQGQLRRLQAALKNLTTSEAQVNEKLTAVTKRETDIKDALQDNKDMAVALASNQGGNKGPTVGQAIQNAPTRTTAPRQGLSGGPAVGRGSFR